MRALHHGDDERSLGRMFMPAPGGPKEVYQRFEEDNHITRGPEGIYMRPSEGPDSAGIWKSFEIHDHDLGANMLRRTFLAGSAAASLTIDVSNPLMGEVKHGDIPTRVFGKTGERLTIIGKREDASLSHP